MTTARDSAAARPELGAAHPWLRKLNVAFLPGAASTVQADVAEGLRLAFLRHGHAVQPVPDDATDVLFAFGTFGVPQSWREAPFFQARRVYRLQKQPMVVTILHAERAPWQHLVGRLERAISQEPPAPEDFDYPGLAPSAYHTLVEQGRRGGPVLAAERLLQAQTVCLRILLVVGDEQPEVAYHFDLVGSLACSDGRSRGFYDDLVLRTVTAASAEEIGSYTAVSPPISSETWGALSTPPAMRRASLELGRRSFFTETVHVGKLVHVPALSGAIANQYSEGCFATWDPALGALIATITGSARPVDKGHITDDELAVIVGMREDRGGVYVRHVEGKRNDPPSSEAYEMIDIDAGLPLVDAGADWPHVGRVPVARSKLHGHRGVASYNPRRVEFVSMGEPYSRYPVTCGTRGQAEGVKAAFARAEALQDPGDPRQIVFTLLPTHGVFIVEKWSPGKAALQAVWEAMDAGDLQITSSVPQGPDEFVPDRTGAVT